MGCNTYIASHIKFMAWYKRLNYFYFYLFIMSETLLIICDSCLEACKYESVDIIEKHKDGTITFKCYWCGAIDRSLGKPFWFP